MQYLSKYAIFLYIIFTHLNLYSWRNKNAGQYQFAVFPNKCLLLFHLFGTITPAKLPINYRLITAYLLLRVNLDKIMHARWDFDASSARTRKVSALDKHQNWSTSALFCLNSRAQSKYAVINLIHTWRNQAFFVFHYVIIRHFSTF